MKEDTLVVHEIYASIQGESTFAGLPCTFVRLTGCNFRCAWCDTPQAFYGGNAHDATTRCSAQALAWARRWSSSPAASRCCNRAPFR